MAKNASIVALEADPDDPDDFDVSEAGIAGALADRAARRNQGGRPRGSDKERVTLRLDKAALDHFREGGAGWQTRINEAVRKAAGL
jgi:uncharacterized protein (DUF4415 family)